MPEMAWPIVVAWIHYIGVMLLMASLLGEHLMLKPELTVAQARTVQRLDGIYGGSATLVLVTGIMRMYLEKGTTYYLQNGPFH
jgi:putative membrane protein